MTQPKDTLAELIQIARDGAEFYDDASKEVKNPQIVELFRRMGAHKRELIAALGGRLESIGGKTPDSGTIAGSLRKGYADVRAKLSSNDEKVYVGQLEETEDRLLHHFEDALKDPDNAAIQAQLQQHFPRVRACHDEMRGWKQRLDRAA